MCVLKDFRDYPVTMILFVSAASNNFESLTMGELF